MGSVLWHGIIFLRFCFPVFHLLAGVFVQLVLVNSAILKFRKPFQRYIGLDSVVGHKNSPILPLCLVSVSPPLESGCASGLALGSRMWLAGGASRKAGAEGGRFRCWLSPLPASELVSPLRTSSPAPPGPGSSLDH